jgi:hypothetical protein
MNGSDHLSPLSFAFRFFERDFGCGVAVCVNLALLMRLWILSGLIDERKSLCHYWSWPVTQVVDNY